MGKSTSNPNGPTHRPLSAYETMIRGLSDRLVEAQRPIHILDAIKWDDDVEHSFFEKGCRRSAGIIISLGRCPSIRSKNSTSFTFWSVTFGGSSASSTLRAFQLRPIKCLPISQPVHPAQAVAITFDLWKR